MFENVLADLRHYSRFCTGGKPLWRVLPTVLYTHPASAAVIWYRFGAAAWGCRWPVVSHVGKFLYVVVMPIVRLYSGVQIQPQTKIGPGLAIMHYGGVVITKKCTIGSNCLLYHNVSIVTMRNAQGATIGSNFYAGTGSTIIGTLTIEDHVTVGAGSVVTKSVPRDAVIAGVPARLLRYREPNENPAENRTLPLRDVGWLTVPDAGRKTDIAASAAVSTKPQPSDRGGLAAPSVR